MNFPAYKVKAVLNDPDYGEIFGIQPTAAYRGNYLMLVYPAEQMVRSIKPDFKMVRSVDQVGVIITSPGRDYDFVSRFFAPAVGIDEDPVTGSAYSSLIPFWAERLDKNRLKAFQCSVRGGMVLGEYANDRVIISGKAITFLEGILSI